jgi:hypothetical protein
VRETRRSDLPSCAKDRLTSWLRERMKKRKTRSCTARSPASIATGRSHLRGALRPQSVCSCRATSPMCLSAIAWSGFDNFYYLFSYEDTRDEFEIPHDRAILAEVFRCPDERMPMRTLTGRATTCSTSSSRDRRTSERGRASKSQTCGQPTASSPPTTRRGNGRATFRLHEGTRTL